MKTRLVIDGNAVYEIDEECEACRYGNEAYREGQKQSETDKRGEQEIKKV